MFLNILANQKAYLTITSKLRQISNAPRKYFTKTPPNCCSLQIFNLNALHRTYSLWVGRGLLEKILIVTVGVMSLTSVGLIASTAVLDAKGLHKEA